MIFVSVVAAPLLHVPGSIWAGSLLRKDSVLALLGMAACAYFAAVALVLRAPPPRWAIAWVLGIAVVARLALVATPPFMSSDVFRYVWDGRVQAAGINPYAHVPNDPALAGLRDGKVYPNINRLDYARTIYPPAAQSVFRAAQALGDSVTATKAALLLLEAAGMCAMWRLLVIAGLPPARLLIYAWNPLAIWSVAADGHIDGAAIGLLGLALLAAVGGWRALSGVLLAAAILTKFLPLAVAPALWRRWDWRMPVACLLAIAAMYACYAGFGWGVGWRVLGFLPTYTTEEGLAQGSGFWALGTLGHAVALPPWAGRAYVAACALALVGLAAWMAFRQRQAEGTRADAVRLCGNTALLAAGAVCAMSAHYPWYYAWLALPCCVRPYRSVLYLSAAPILLYCDPFHDEMLFPTLVFVPALLLAAADWRWPVRVTATPA